MSDLHGFHGKGWIGVDLDGTLATYDKWIGPEHIGEPITKMIERVVAWIESGRDVRIVTARVSPIKGEEAELCRAAVQKWLAKHVYPKCPLWFREPFQIEFNVTHEKDQHMIELWDDRCVQVIPNTGLRADGKE